MSKLSAIILTKNEERMIADCIDSISFCDEIIVIDSGSSDRTADLAKHMGAKVFHLLSGSFSDRRNYGLKKTKNKWVLYIDADERVSPELKKNILEVVEKDKSSYSVYRLKRKNFYFGNHEWPHLEFLERLFKKTALVEWYGQIHETPRVKGEIGELEGFLLHYTHRDLSSMVEKTIEWSKVEAELRLNAHHPKMTWWRFFRVMITAFYNSYIKQKGYKAGTAGLVESIYQTFSIFITYARLWEMQQESIKKKV